MWRVSLSYPGQDLPTLGILAKRLVCYGLLLHVYTFYTPLHWVPGLPSDSVAWLISVFKCNPRSRERTWNNSNINDPHKNPPTSSLVVYRFGTTAGWPSTMMCHNMPRCHRWPQPKAKPWSRQVRGGMFSRPSMCLRISPQASTWKPRQSMELILDAMWHNQ